jgi:lipoate-protein ligase A
MRQWRLIFDVPARGAHNMAVDEAILWAVSADLTLPTLRFYAWSPPCLSLGYAQKTADIDFQRVTELEWEVVRRPTGGRAILHADELTYSVALPADHPLAAGDIVESYRRISQALMAGLQHLGLNPQADRKTHHEINGPVCFDTPSHYEIMVNGRKLVGSAQVRRKGGLLQHGSLPLRGDLGRICDGLMYPDEASHQQAKARVRAKGITLEAALGTAVSWRTAAESLAQGFITALDMNFVESALTDAESERAAYLASEIYVNVDWNRRRFNQPDLG